jgi:uncharacterized membrane protein YqjE
VINTIEKVKEIGAITLDRVNDYIELIRVELEIAQHELARRTGQAALLAACVFLAAMFIGLAVIVSYWDSAYRVAAAWGVAAVWVLAALVCYARQRAAQRPGPGSGLIRDAVQQDIAFLKELL